MSRSREDGDMTAEKLLNTTAALDHEETNTAQFEVKVFNMVIMSLALFILTITGLYYITVCYSRSRQSKRAHVYESAVTRGDPVDPVAVKAVKRSTSFVNPLAFFRRAEAAKDNSRIYYIYSNPLPVGDQSEERTTPSFQDYANDPDSGITLDPPVFYMQL